MSELLAAKHPSNYSDVLVLPVLAVVNDTFALNVGVEAIVDVVASGTQVPRELEVDAVEDGALRSDFLGSLTDGLGACSVDNLGIVGNDICNGQKFEFIVSLF